MLYIILGLIVLILILYKIILILQPTLKKDNRLRQQCRKLLNFPSKEADETIDRLILRQKERNPGHTEEWYLEKVLFDLEKDMRR